MIDNKNGKEKNTVSFLLLLVILLSAFSMRGPMGCVGPLMSEIRPGMNLNATLAGLLTTLPLLFFAVTAPFSVVLSARFGIRRMIPSSLFVVLLGILLRSQGEVWALFLGTALIGGGTGCLNVLVPAFFKEYYPEKSGKLTGVYSSSLTIASATTAAVIQPISHALNSWNGALLSFFVFPLLSCLLSAVYMQRIRENEKKRDESEEKSPLFTRRNISIALYMGLQSLIFFTMLTWFPSMAASLYDFTFNSGILITVMQLSSLIPAYIVPNVTTKKNARILSTSLAFLFAPGIILCLIGRSIPVLIAGTVITGLSLGSTFSMAITLCSLYGKNGKDTARIVSFGQCIGYILASIGPTGFGAVYDASSTWAGSLIILASLASLMAAIGFTGVRKE